MLRYFDPYEIDRKKWDLCIQNSKAGHIYGLSWYLDLVAPGWSGIVQDDYKSVMPLPIRKKIGIKYVYQPLFAQQLGVFSPDPTSSELVASFLDAIPKEIRYIDVNLNFTNLHIYNLKSITAGKVNFELKLKKKYPQLKAAYSDNTKRNIQRSAPFLEIMDKVSIPELIRLKRENSLKRKPSEYYEWLNCFIHNLVKSGHGRITGAYMKGVLCAAALFVNYGKRIYYLIPVSDPTGKKNRAMFGILDNQIQTFAENDLILDFEGSNISGIARFFEGFGATPHRYPSVKLNRLPLWLKCIKK